MNVGSGAAIFGCGGTRLLPSERDFFRDYDPFGFILFARNVADPDQLRRLTGDLRAAVGRDAPILIDQEGGRVQRMRSPHWREWLPPLDQVLRSGAHWCDLPERYGRWKTLHKRFSRWSKAGVWDRVFADLIKDRDNQYLMIDSTLVRAHQQAATGKGGPRIRLWGAPEAD